MVQKNFQQLICPIDGKALSLNSVAHKSTFLTCDSGHCFDIAKQGYVNLLPVQQKKSLAPGDSKAMVEARNRFLNSGAYQSVLNQLCDLIDDCSLPENARILDAGCGEGYYTKQLAEKFPQPQLIGLDISKEALKVASNKNDEIDWLVATNSQLPIEPASIDLIVCIFGFHSFAGFSKVLKPKGKIILVDPDEDHLIELRQAIYKEVKKRPAYKVDDAGDYNLSLLKEERLKFNSKLLSQKEIQDLLLMTPHLFRASKEGKGKAESLENCCFTVDMLFRVLSFEEN